ncbi:transposon Ty3-G Gag-Pol polyprotein [Trichonephila clavipes]|nr:transposon Ty3-G Gag-Pol polyprotein [Trichonephila clavipes]
MKSPIKKWVRCCESRLKSKIQSPTKTPLETFSVPEARFNHIHIDIVGPLPPSEGHHYLLTKTDCFSRTASGHRSPMDRSNPYFRHQANTIFHAIFDSWISRFGCPSVITSDKGAQMRSSMYVEFTRMLGSEKMKTTIYHSKSNGIVERFHRHLKSAIKPNENDTWSEIVPIIPLGIRTAVKEDL